jgi:uncharacterized RDD family membrane protein YckC
MAQGGRAPWAAQDGPAPGVEYGGFGLRFVALAIDIILLGIVEGVFQAVSLLFVAPVISVAYVVGMWGFTGQTIGMMPFGLRIVRAADGSRMTWTNVILRFIGWFACWLIVFPVCIGFFWAAFDPKKQGWHDKVAGTVVIRSA